MLLAGCGSDPCRTLCQRLAVQLDGCREEWGASWEDLGADNRTEYRLTCQEGWDALRADLEARQVPAAEDECQDGADALPVLTCDELRVLYL